jgi:DNA polymerase-3 subunit beta
VLPPSPAADRELLIVTTTVRQLKVALGTVGVVIPSKTLKPILGTVKLAVTDGAVTLAGTNLEVGVQLPLPTTNATGEGALCLPADTLIELVKLLPDKDSAGEPTTLTLTLDTDPTKLSTQLVCGRFVTGLKGLASEDFPHLPLKQETSASAILPAGVFASALADVAFAAASENSGRPALEGVAVWLHKGDIRFGATDGFRLAQRIVQLAEPANLAGLAEIREVLPASAARLVKEILAALAPEQATTIHLNHDLAFITAGDVEVVSRLIDAKYPEYEKAIPSTKTLEGVFPMEVLAQAVKLAALCAPNNHLLTLTFTPGDGTTPGTLHLATNDGDNAGEGEVSGAISGQAAHTVHCNHKFLLQALKTISTPEVTLRVNTSRTPLVLLPVDQDGHTQVVLPMSA